MTRRASLVIASAVAAVAVCGAAFAAKAPKAMVLQLSDLPAGARVTAKHGQSSAAGSGYYVSYSYRSGKPRALSSFVSVWKSRELALMGFRGFKDDTPSSAERLALPKYGDQQYASFQGGDGAQLIVLTGNVVWVLKAEQLLSSGLTKAEGIAELKRYAPKQLRRVRS